MIHNRPERAKMSPLFLVLAGITLSLASWGYFRLFTDNAGMPHGLALLSVGGLDLAAVLLGKHALTVAEDGDSSAPWNAALLALTALGSYAQFEHARLAGDALAIGIVSAAFPVVTVLLFEGQLRRVYRLNGRAAGRLAGPRATIDLVTWLFFRRIALRATKLGVLDRGLDSDAAMLLAERQLEIAAENADQRPARRALRRTYAAELSDGSVIDLAGPDIEPDVRVHLPDNGPDKPDNSPDVPDNGPDESDNGPDNVSDVRRRGDLARAVERAVEIVGDDFEPVLAVVRIAYPNVDPDSVRRTLNRRRTG